MSVRDWIRGLLRSMLPGHADVPAEPLPVLLKRTLQTIVTHCQKSEFIGSNLTYVDVFALSNPHRDGDFQSTTSPFWSGIAWDGANMWVWATR